MVYRKIIINLSISSPMRIKHIESTEMEITIQNRKIGDGHPVFVIAEAGVNHNGDLELGKKLIEVAKDAGADAVKFQSFKAEKLNTRTAPKSTYHIETTGSDKQQSWYELLKTQEISYKMHQQLIAHCKEKDIIFLSTPYDESSADTLDELGVPAFKLASTDTNNFPLIRHIARKQKPFILSTAMCDMEEVEEAVKIIRDEDLKDLVVLQCTGNYPARLEKSHLRVILSYREILQCLVGYSDHTSEMINPIAAVALGACVYEKHFTLDKSLPGPDHRMSLSPDELRETVQVIRLTEKALGGSEKYVLPSEQENRVKLRKSLVTATSISQGVQLTEKMITVKRPGTGIPPSRLEHYLGKTINVDVEEDSVLFNDMFK